MTREAPVFRPGRFTPPAILFYRRADHYGFLSNFWQAQQVVDGVPYRTNEHFYQSQKAKSPAASLWIRDAPTAWLAMKAGRALREKETVEDWQKIKVEVMLKGLRAKFSQNGDLADALLATGEAPIHENSTEETAPGGKPDRFWGIKGEDWLGRLLVQVREELRLDRAIGKVA